MSEETTTLTFAEMEARHVASSARSYRLYKSQKANEIVAVVRNEFAELVEDGFEDEWMLDLMRMVVGKLAIDMMDYNEE